MLGQKSTGDRPFLNYLRCFFIIAIKKAKTHLVLIDLLQLHQYERVKPTKIEENGGIQRFDSEPVPSA